MKKLGFPVIAILLVAVVTFSSSYKSFIRFSYEINKLEIIEKFCINKDKPDLKCDGKCHLKATLDKVDEDNNMSNEAESSSQNQLLLFKVDFNSIKVTAFTKGIKLISKYNNLYSYLTQASIFHPPPKS